MIPTLIQPQKLRSTFAWLLIFAQLMVPTLVRAEEPIEGQEPTGAEVEQTLQQVPEIPIANLPNRMAADKLGETVRQQIQGKADIIIYHTGDHVPQALRYLAAKLKKDGVTVKVSLITERELDDEVVKAGAETEATVKRLTYEREDVAQGIVGKIQEMTQSARLGVKQLFGVPNGISWWIPVYRDKAAWRAATMGGVSALATAIPSAAITLYLSHAPVHNIFLNGAAFGAWVFTFAILGRNFNEIFNQGKTLSAKSATELEVKDSMALFYGLSGARSLLTGTVFIGSAFPAEMMKSATYTHTAMNTLINLPGQWINRTMKNIAPDAKTGEPKVPGITAARWEMINTAVQFSYGLVKSIDQVATKLKQHWAIFPRGLYWLMGVVGTGKILWDSRWNYYQNMRALSSYSTRFFRDTEDQCASLLVIRPKEDSVSK